MPIRFSPMTLDPSAAVEADIFVAEDGRPWRAPTWPSADGVAVILCSRFGVTIVGPLNSILSPDA